MDFLYLFIEKEEKEGRREGHVHVTVKMLIAVMKNDVQSLTTKAITDSFFFFPLFFLHHKF